MSVGEKLLTVQAFWEKYANQPFELVEGEVIPVTPAGGRHGSVGSRTITQLRLFVDENDLGEVYSSETGFYLNETTMRGTDAAFVRKDRLKLITDPEKFVPFAPDLAVEIVSPGDTASEVQKKVELYLAAGTRLVWIMFPELRQVVAHTPDGKSRTYKEGDLLDGGDVLPGLKIPVSKLFPPEHEQDTREEN